MEKLIERLTHDLIYSDNEGITISHEEAKSIIKMYNLVNAQDEMVKAVNEFCKPKVE